MGQVLAILAVCGVLSSCIAACDKMMNTNPNKDTKDTTAKDATAKDTTAKDAKDKQQGGKLKENYWPTGCYTKRSDMHTWSETELPPAMKCWLWWENLACCYCCHGPTCGLFGFLWFWNCCCMNVCEPCCLACCPTYAKKQCDGTTNECLIPPVSDTTCVGLQFSVYFDFAELCRMGGEKNPLAQCCDPCMQCLTSIKDMCK